MKRLIAVVLIVSMIFTTGGFAVLADSVDLVIETTKSESVETTPHKYYDDLISENTNTTSVGENTDTKGVNDDVGAKLSEPEEKEDDEPSSNEYTEEPEVDETTAKSYAEQDFDGEETTTAEVTTEELSSETTTNTSEEPTTTIISEETITNTSEEPTSKETTIIAPTSSIEDTTTNVSEEQTSATIISEETTTTEPTTVAPKEITNTESANTATESVTAEENTNIENQTEEEGKISTSSYVDEIENIYSDVSTTSDAVEIENKVATESYLLENELVTATLSEIDLATLSDIVLLPEIATMSSTQLFGAGPLAGGIWFGTYPQNDADGVQLEPIRWYVKNQSDTEALLIAEYILDNVSFDNYHDRSWENSYIRDWLNNEFKNKVFTTEQQAGIVDKYLTTVGSNPTYDKVFLLSSHEANTFLRQRNTDDYWDLGEIRGRGTTYAKNVDNNGGKLTERELEGGKVASIYWVRDKSGADVGTIFPHYRFWEGDTEIRWFEPWDRHIGVRPALYVNLNSDIFKTSDNAVSFDLAGGSWKSGSTMWQYFGRYQGGQKLPTVANINGPNGAKLLGWVSSDAPDTIITEIAPDKTGDISLKAKYKFDITWRLSGGNWNGTVGSASYIYRDNYVLPTNIIPPTGKFFDHWEINGELATSITSEDYGDKTIRAVYGELPAYIWLGTYPQNDIEGTQSEPVKWSVLTQNGSEALLLADRIIDVKRYNENDSPVTWDNSDVRTWLKGDFKNKIFTTEQFDNILINKNISTTEGGASVTTNDKVILLSSDDADDYLTRDDKRKAYITAYSANIMSVPENYYGPWWLRERGTGGDNYAKYVDSPGPIRNAGLPVNTNMGIRPAIYVDLSKQLIRTSKNSVTWHLNHGSWKEDSSLWASFDQYQVGQKLPTVDNIVEPTDGEFLGWTYESNSDDVVTEIALDKKGDITLEAKYRYNITWDLHDGALGPEGSWAGTVGPDHYVNGVGIPNLPTNVNGPSEDRVFDHWEIDGTTVTSVTASDYGAKTIKAVYKYYVPDYIWFGTYPQNDKSGIQYEPIKWKVINSNSNEAFLVSDKILAKKNYNDEKVEITWENSTIRGWLNGDFKNTAFTTAEVTGIVDKTIQTPGQNDTTDKIFLLSKNEAETYLSSSAERITTSTAYGYNESATEAENKWWWLRDKGTMDGGAGVAVTVANTGYVWEPGVDVNHGHWIGTRPALCFNLNSQIFKKQNNNISFDLDGGSFKTESALWNEMTTYQGGLKLPTSDNINNPVGKEFIGWSLVGETATISEISATTTGNVDLIANYKNAHYKLTFEMEEGHLIATPSEYEYSVGMQLPVATDIVSPTGRAFSHWEINGVAVRDITPTDYGDKVLKAIFTNVLYGITFDMGEGHLVSTPSNYEYSVGLTLPASSEVVAPRGRTFDHWEIDGQTATSISESETGEKTITAVYTNNRYQINWYYQHMDFSWTFIDGFDYPTEYEYGTGIPTLPDNSKINFAQYDLTGWYIINEDEGTLTSGTEISPTSTGNLRMMGIFNPATFNINYVDENGNPVSWDGAVGPSAYEYGDFIILPRNVIAPENKVFDHWEIDGNVVGNIDSSDYGDKTIVAKYRNKQYNITWRLTEHNEFFDYDFVGDWNGTPGEDTYTYGTSYQLPTNITPPPGMLFDMWEFADNPGYAVTTISETDYGDKIIQAIYRSEEYNVTWNLNGAVLSVNADASPLHPNVYMYGDVLFGPFPILDITAPDTFDSIPAGKTVSHWTINGVPATEIPQGTMGDLVITLVFTDIPTHNITWDYGSGENQWSFNGYVPPATYSEGITVVFPDKSFVVAPNGKEIDYFTLNGNQATEIPATSTTDVTVGAVLKNKTYRIRYILGNGSWDGASGAENYTHGTPYTLPTNVNGTTGQVFDHWEIGGVATTSILASDYGHKEFTAVYDNKTYNINWVLKGATIDPTLTPDTYTYGTAVALPALTDITPATGLTFDHWEINGIVATEIQAGTIGDVTITLMYASDEIVWQLDGGQFRNYTAPSRYERGIGLILPTPDQILAPNGYTFNYWLVNGTQNTVIPSDLTGAVIVKAVYSAIPTPAPEPYNPGGGGGSSGGGGGGGRGGTITNDATPLVTKINQIKTIKLAADISQITWVYEPISNKFKMNIEMTGQTIPATDGFYLVSTIDERKVNGVTTYVPGTSTYYFDKEGNMITGWVNTVDNKWYYLENVKTAREGMMVFGWYQVQNKWYYFLSDGTMLSNNITPDGYIVGADGAWVQ